MVVAGYGQLARHKDELIKTNVFPIPDADTGNNMKKGSPVSNEHLCCHHTS